MVRSAILTTSQIFRSCIVSRHIWRSVSLPYYTLPSRPLLLQMYTILVSCEPLCLVRIAGGLLITYRRCTVHPGDFLKPFAQAPFFVHICILASPPSILLDGNRSSALIRACLYIRCIYTNGVCLSIASVRKRNTS